VAGGDLSPYVTLNMGGPKGQVGVVDVRRRVTFGGGRPRDGVARVVDPSRLHPGSSGAGVSSIIRVRQANLPPGRNRTFSLAGSAGTSSTECEPAAQSRFQPVWILSAPGPGHAGELSVGLAVPMDEHVALLEHDGESAKNIFGGGRPRVP
jgi:hypothetical protein